MCVCVCVSGVFKFSFKLYTLNCAEFLEIDLEFALLNKPWERACFDLCD